MFKVIVICLTLCSVSFISAAESKRVYVYPLEQATWQVKPGETLSGIAAALLPQQAQQQQSLMNSIFRLNPAAFINGDPNLLQARYKLVLPANVQTHHVNRPAAGKVKHYNWGSIRRSRE